MPPDCEFVMIDSKVARQLADTNAYNACREDCEHAAAELKVSALRDVSIAELSKIEKLPSHLKKRARHVITENHRVLEAALALREGRLQDFGKLMYAAHKSLKEDFQVSHPKLDAMVAAAEKYGALGARLTGAGFGGCMIALLDPAQNARWCAAMQADFPDTQILKLSF